jgi:hypothetical protein
MIYYNCMITIRIRGTIYSGGFAVKKKAEGAGGQAPATLAAYRIRVFWCFAGLRARGI